MSFVGVILVGLPITLGVGWQFMVFRRDFGNSKTPSRIKFSLFLGSVIIFGILVHSVFTLFDNQQTVDIWLALTMLFKATILGFMFFITSWLGPIYSGFLMAWCTYCLHSGSDLSHVPFLTALVSWVFNTASEGVVIAYIAISSAIILLLSSKDSIKTKDREQA